MDAGILEALMNNNKKIAYIHFINKTIIAEFKASSSMVTVLKNVNLTTLIIVLCSLVITGSRFVH